MHVKIKKIPKARADSQVINIYFYLFFSSSKPFKHIFIDFKCSVNHSFICRFFKEFEFVRSIRPNLFYDLSHFTEDYFISFLQLYFA